MKRSGLALAFAGVIGMLFFWATDPKWGWAPRTEGLVDLVHQSTVGTFVGLAGSVVVVFIGLWLMSRKTA